MQYKIPVQIENEDTIFLGLSLRQLGIIMIGGGIAYSLFKSLEVGIGPQAASVPSILIIIITLFIALFKNSEMTFLPFLLNMVRLNLNGGSRVWQKGTESFSSLEIWYVSSYAQAQRKMESKWSIESVDNLQESLQKL